MTEKRTYEKSTCCINGCARWSRQYPPNSEWICGRHWKMIRRSRRRALRKLWRIINGYWSVLDSGGGVDMTFNSPFNKARKSERFIWRAAKKEATLRAAGL